MRLSSNSKQPTIEVVYQQKKFSYFRSQQKIINPWIDINEALKDCFIQRSVSVRCSFFQKKNISWNVRLRPSSDIFYKTASDMYVIKKSLDVLFAASFKEDCVVRLCLELTKHPWYQSIEMQHQKRKRYQDGGYLSRLQTSQQVAKRLYKIFQLHYSNLYCEDIEAEFEKKKYRSPRPPQPSRRLVGIYPIRY